MARDIEHDYGDHILEYGDCLEGDIIRGRLYGHPGNPLIVIPGGISASRFIADADPLSATNGKGWWAELVAPGGAIDLNRHQVLGFDFAPTGKNAQKRLTITTNDQAKRLAALLDHLGVKQCGAMIGTSYGGMVALAFAQNHPRRLGRLCVLGAAHRPFAMGVGVRSIQRRIIEMALDAGRPDAGLKLARELAMTTYRSAQEFSQRFDAKPVAGLSEAGSIRFDVGDYLEARGRHYHKVMPINRFLALSESIDLHKIDPAKITVPTTLIATSSDQLVPPCEMKAMADLLAGPTDFITINSLYGHDSFLKETEALAPLLADFTKERRNAA